MRTSKKIVSSVLAVCMLASTSVIAGAAATGSDSAMLIGLYCFTGNSKFNAGYTYADFEYVDFQK